MLSEKVDPPDTQGDQPIESTSNSEATLEPLQTPVFPAHRNQPGRASWYLLPVLRPPNLWMIALDWSRFVHLLKDVGYWHNKSTFQLQRIARIQRRYRYTFSSLSTTARRPTPPSWIQLLEACGDGRGCDSLTQDLQEWRSRELQAMSLGSPIESTVVATDSITTARENKAGTWMRIEG